MKYFICLRKGDYILAVVAVAVAVAVSVVVVVVAAVADVNMFFFFFFLLSGKAWKSHHPKPDSHWQRCG